MDTLTTPHPDLTDLAASRDAETAGRRYRAQVASLLAMTDADFWLLERETLPGQWITLRSIADRDV